MTEETNKLSYYQKNKKHYQRGVSITSMYQLRTGDLKYQLLLSRVNLFYALIKYG